MTVEGIGFTDTVSLAQTIGIVGTRITVPSRHSHWPPRISSLTVAFPLRCG
jgi:hypothetical protein